MKICEICGISIPSNRKYCSECADCANKGTTEKSHEKLKSEKNMRRYHSRNLEKDVAKAYKMHLSYGEYMALKMRGKLN